MPGTKHPTPLIKTNIKQQQQQQQNEKKNPTTTQKFAPLNIEEVKQRHVAGLRIRFVQFGFIWVTIVCLNKIATYLKHQMEMVDRDRGTVSNTTNTTTNTTITIKRGNTGDDPWIKNPCGEDSFWNGYDNHFWNITEEERMKFHPVIRFPKIWIDVEDEHDDDDDAKNDEMVKKRKKQRPKRKQVFDYQVMDFTSGGNGTVLQQGWEVQRDLEMGAATALALLSKSEDKPKKELSSGGANETSAISSSRKKNCRGFRKLLKRCSRKRPPGERGPYSIGRYNENRLGDMYSTSLFKNKCYDIDSYDGMRTVHMGIDLYAPVGTKVFAFEDGIVHSSGYNPLQGDYGHVIVLEHPIGSSSSSASPRRTLWALYGHLSKRSIKGKKKGKKIKKGNVVGWIGNPKDNGGWSQPHVHFQLSVNEPETHDMPGVVSCKDRKRAIGDYPDPRIVLGPLY